MKFLGIDLGWSSGASGLCCLAWQAGELQLMDLQRQHDLSEIFAWIDRHLPAPESGGIAVDAPTLIPNLTGMRECDRLAHKYFGRYDAGCYPANQGRPFAQRLIQFGQQLETRGFAHAPTIHAQQLGRFQIEVFPHPAMIHLFQIPKIIKYKKGTVAERRIELARFHGYICDVLPNLDPPLNLESTPNVFPRHIPHKGKDLKALEDQLDSLICAYVAAHWWFWGQDRNWVLGDRTQGYIVVPAPRSDDPIS